jgi:hypothetical protein
MRSARPHSQPAIAKGLAALAIAAALALGACGGDSETDEPAAQPLGEEIAGSVAPLAQCRDWNRGSEAEKLATIEEIRSQVNLEDSGVDAPPLSDAEAMSVFENACAAPFAAGFRLYVLYARAAGFAPLARGVAP